MMYVLIILVSVLNYPSPVLLEIDEFRGKPLRFQTAEECETHAKSNSISLRLFAQSLFPEDAILIGGSFVCIKEKDSPFRTTPILKV
tara:strand:- start:324 stop:584 length:261 start_codon:yes stop_codon:yes gene_type:complete